MGRPVLLALSVVVVGVHGIARIHGGQKQKDIKSDPQSEITPSTPFFGARMHILFTCSSQLAHLSSDSLPYHRHHGKEPRVPCCWALNMLANIYIIILH